MLNFVIAKALAKKPDERYQSASDFANDLRECAKQLSTEQPASAAAPGPPVDDAKTELVDMFKTMVRSRLGDATEIADETPTIGVSRKFDSYEATLKVASQTGMAEELEDYAKTQKIVSQPAAEEPVAARSGRHETVGTTTVATPTAAAGNMTLAEKLASHEDWLLGAGIVVAVLVAALIVFF